MPKETFLVYSTQLGSIRPETTGYKVINRKESVCCVRRETKGRNGKEATIVWNVPGGEADLKSIGKAIKQRLGTGGSVKDGQIVIQGDHVETVLIFLRDKGFQAKKAGG